LVNADIARVLYLAGRLAAVQNDYAAAQAYHLQALEVARNLGDNPVGRQVTSDALGSLSQVARRQGDFDQARRYIEEQLRMAREVSNESGIAKALANLGNVALYQGDYELARRNFEESLTMDLKLGKVGRVAATYVNLGLVAQAQGDYEAARSRYSQALEIWQARGNKVGIATTLENLGDLEWKCGNPDDAAIRYAQALDLYCQVGSRRGIARCLLAMARVWGLQGRPKEAATLTGAAESLFATVGFELLPADKEEYERGLVALREALSEEAFAAARRQGEAMSMEEAIAYALATGVQPEAVAPGLELYPD
jgi:tetratricopeptide (TPR) repeat protein